MDAPSEHASRAGHAIHGHATHKLGPLKAWQWGAVVVVGVGGGLYLRHRATLKAAGAVPGSPSAPGVGTFATSPTGSGSNDLTGSLPTGGGGAFGSGFDPSLFGTPNFGTTTADAAPSSTGADSTNTQPAQPNILLQFGPNTVAGGGPPKASPRTHMAKSKKPTVHMPKGQHPSQKAARQVTAHNNATKRRNTAASHPQAKATHRNVGKPANRESPALEHREAVRENKRPVPKKKGKR